MPRSKPKIEYQVMERTSPGNWEQVGSNYITWEQANVARSVLKEETENLLKVQAVRV